MSEALILASTNPQYDDRLFSDLQVQYMKIPSSEHGENMLCTKHVLPRFELVIFMYWTCNSMNNLLSYCGLIDTRIRASDKDLPVKNIIIFKVFTIIYLSKAIFAESGIGQFSIFKLLAKAASSLTFNWDRLVLKEDK